LNKAALTILAQLLGQATSYSQRTASKVLLHRNANTLHQAQVMTVQTIDKAVEPTLAS
jgi:hypothetical protein